MSNERQKTANAEDVRKRALLDLARLLDGVSPWDIGEVMSGIESAYVQLSSSIYVSLFESMPEQTFIDGAVTSLRDKLEQSIPLARTIAKEADARDRDPFTVPE